MAKEEDTGVRNRQLDLSDGREGRTEGLKKETNVKCLFTTVHFSDLIQHTR